MATPLAVGNLLEVINYCKAYDQLALNVLHFRVAALVGAWELEDLPEKMFDDQVVYYDDLLAPEASFAGVGVRRLSPGVKTIQYFSTNAPVPGGYDPPIMPTQVCGIITFLTGAAGKENYGRAYIPFPSAVALDPATGRPDSNYVDFLIDLAGLWDGYTATEGGNSITLEQRIVSARNPAGLVINQWVAQEKFATQRRRGNYGQPNNTPF